VFISGLEVIVLTLVFLVPFSHSNKCMIILKVVSDLSVPCPFKLIISHPFVLCNECSEIKSKFCHYKWYVAS
jgi:hypothetical protein